MRSGYLFEDDVKLKALINEINKIATVRGEIVRYEKTQKAVCFDVNFKTLDRYNLNKYKIHVNIDIEKEIFNITYINNIHNNIRNIYNINKYIYTIYMLYSINIHSMKYIIKINYLKELITCLLEPNVLVVKNNTDNRFKFYHSDNGIYMIQLIDKKYRIKKFHEKSGMFKLKHVVKSYMELIENTLKEL